MYIVYIMYKVYNRCCMYPSVLLVEENHCISTCISWSQIQIEDVNETLLFGVDEKLVYQKQIVFLHVFNLILHCNTCKVTQYPI